jgi:hypothetical protein
MFDKEVIVGNGYRCKRCNYGWVSRKSEPPITCPRCKSPFWNRLKKAQEPLDEKKLLNYEQYFKGSGVLRYKKEDILEIQADMNRISAIATHSASTIDGNTGVKIHLIQEYFDIKPNMDKVFINEKKLKEIEKLIGEGDDFELSATFKEDDKRLQFNYVTLQYKDKNFKFTNLVFHAKSATWSPLLPAKSP